MLCVLKGSGTRSALVRYMLVSSPYSRRRGIWIGIHLWALIGWRERGESMNLSTVDTAAKPRR